MPALSVVVIGRNEGERLARCLASVAAMSPVGGPMETIYVDSASTDGSVARAARFGARVISVAPARPCAASGRNAGWKAARAPVVMFLDGDTVLAPDFAAQSLAEFDDPLIAVVWGRRREIDPGASIFNRVLDLDWIDPPWPQRFLRRRCADPALCAGRNRRVRRAPDRGRGAGALLADSRAGLYAPARRSRDGMA